MSDQHNRMLGWLQSTLCQIYAKQGGTCTSFIGPLQEDQEHIPMELVWPEDQPTVLEQLQQIQSTLSNHGVDQGLIGGTQRVMASGSNVEIVALKLQIDEMRMKVKGMVDMHEDVEGKVNEVKGSMKDAMEVNVEELKDAMEVKVQAVEVKVEELKDAVEVKVDAVEVKVEELKDSMNEVKEMMSKLMQMMQ